MRIQLSVSVRKDGELPICVGLKTLAKAPPPFSLWIYLHKHYFGVLLITITENLPPSIKRHKKISSNWYKYTGVYQFHTDGRNASNHICLTSCFFPSAVDAECIPSYISDLSFTPIHGLQISVTGRCFLPFLPSHSSQCYSAIVNILENAFVWMGSLIP